MLARFATLGALAASLAMLVSCASQPANAPTPGPHAGHGDSPALAAAPQLASTAPLKADAARLWVKGLSCPLCAHNVDQQLLKLDGVQSVNVDLDAGSVDLALAGASRPSPKQLADAIADAGFTLDRIEETAR